MAQASSLPAPATSTCSKVSAASVAAVVGHPVPAGTLSTHNLKATKADDEISAVVTSCIYGSVTSLTALGKDVLVGFEVTSKPLGMKAFYYTFTEAGIPIQGIEAIDGTTVYSAGRYTKTPAAPELSAL